MVNTRHNYSSQLCRLYQHSIIEASWVSGWLKFPISITTMNIKGVIFPPTQAYRLPQWQQHRVRKKSGDRGLGCAQEYMTAAIRACVAGFYESCVHRQGKWQTGRKDCVFVQEWEENRKCWCKVCLHTFWISTISSAVAKEIESRGISWRQEVSDHRNRLLDLNHMS